MKRVFTMVLIAALVLTALVMPAYAENDNLLGKWTGTFSGKMSGVPLSGAVDAVVTQSSITLTIYGQAISGSYSVKGDQITVTTADGQSSTLTYKLAGDALTLTGAIKYGILEITDVVIEMTRGLQVEIKAPHGLFPVEEGQYEAVKGDRIQLEAQTNVDSLNVKIAWKSAKSKFAVITAKGGMLKCKAPGETTVSVTAKEGKSTAQDSILVRVVELKLNKTKAKLYMAGNTKKKPGEIQLSYTVKPANASEAAQTIAWQVSDPEVLTVTADGLVKPLKAGKALAIATNQYGQAASCEITVK